MASRILRKLFHLFNRRAERRLRAVESLANHADLRAQMALAKHEELSRRLAAMDLDSLIAAERGRDE